MFDFAFLIFYSTPPARGHQAQTPDQRQQRQGFLLGTGHSQMTAYFQFLPS
jgi:hypothetical protein